MTNNSVTASVFQTSAAMGVDVISDTNAHTPPSGSNGWKYLVVSVEAVINAITDNGSPVSTNLTGVTFSAGTLISANGLFTSVDLTSGTAILIRG